MKNFVEMTIHKIESKKSFDHNSDYFKNLPNKENRLKRFKNHSIKEIFLDFALRSNLDCFHKIFEYNENPVAKFLWTIVLLVSSGLTFFLISVSLIEYFNFEVVSQIAISDEIKSIFPTVTICDSNPFTTNEAEILYEKVAAMNRVSTSHEKITEFVKLKAADPSYGDRERKLLGFNISKITNCSFNGEPCFLNEFHWYWDYHYGNCWQFNSGLDIQNKQLELKDTYSGTDFGLEITISHLENNNKYSISNPDGLIIFIHNSSFNPYKADSFAFAKPGEKTFISVNRIFTSKQPQPYSQCIDLQLYSSDLYNLIVRLNRTYRQSHCFRYCRQKSYNENCNCTLYSNDGALNPETRFCSSSDDYYCTRREFYNFNKEKCIQESCPLECNSVKYELGISSLVYPSFQLYNNQSNEVKRNLTFESFKSAWVSFLIYYPTQEYTTINESPKITKLELFGIIGGTLSIFVSISIFTLFEIIELSILVIHAIYFNKLH